MKTRICDGGIVVKKKKKRRRKPQYIHFPANKLYACHCVAVSNYKNKRFNHD
jgi:hypothetical protein